jgi:hypothetical protein
MFIKSPKSFYIFFILLSINFIFSYSIEKTEKEVAAKINESTRKSETDYEKERELLEIVKELGTNLKNKIKKAKKTIEKKTPQIVKKTIENIKNKYKKAVKYTKEKIEQINNKIESDETSIGSKVISSVKKIPQICKETSKDFYDFSKDKIFNFLFERKSNLIDIKIRDALASKDINEETRKIYEKIKGKKKEIDNIYEESNLEPKKIYELIVLFSNEMESFFKKYEFLIKNNIDKDIIKKEIENFLYKLEIYENFV